MSDSPHSKQKKQWPRCICSVIPPPSFFLDLSPYKQKESTADGSPIDYCPDFSSSSSHHCLEHRTKKAEEEVGMSG